MCLRENLIGFALFATFLAGCATPNPAIIQLKNQSVSLGELKTIIHEVIPLGIRTISANGREFVSQVYNMQNGQYIAAKDVRVRYWARILVLNERRPYDIEIEVRKEVRDERGGSVKYTVVGSDQSLAEILRIQLKDRLAKRRDDLNLIDDFRVF